MPAVESSTVPIRESGPTLKMEDRKRPFDNTSNNNNNNNDATASPPLKKQATAQSPLNGESASASKPASTTPITHSADTPVKDDFEQLEMFQKNAIYRRMLELRREKNSLESRLTTLQQSCTYHDDHLRFMDAWFKQLIDEVKIILSVPESDRQENLSSFSSSLFFAENTEFEQHLKARFEDIASIIRRLLSVAPKTPTDISDLQTQLSRALAIEKAAVANVERCENEKEQLESRLETASLRYMVAEKKLDRAKNAAKVESQYQLGAHKSKGANDRRAKQEEKSSTLADEHDERIRELEESFNKAKAIHEKRKEQLEKLETDNSKLLRQVTELKIKLTKLSDDDFAGTDLFKQLRLQHEDVIRRINHLEATNLHLREDAQKLQAERTSYRNETQEELRIAAADLESQLGRLEADLTRVRNARDELLADQQMKKAALEQDRTALAQMEELLEAKEARIVALESEADRLRIQIAPPADANLSEDAARLTLEELQSKYKILEQQYTMLNTELLSMQTAFRKTSRLAGQRISEVNAQEQKIQRLAAEKSKADQKYFAAMKSKEARETELRALRIQNMKSSDVVSQLKEAESSTRLLLTNVEKQLSETKEALTSAFTQKSSVQQRAAESDVVIEGLKNQVTELKKVATSRDSSLSSSQTSLRKYETEIAALKSTLSDMKKNNEMWRGKAQMNTSTENDMLRTLALCTVCRRDFKNTVIKTCGHVFCQPCVKERLTSRSRKCPICSKSFGTNDQMHITL